MYFLHSGCSFLIIWFTSFWVIFPDVDQLWLMNKSQYWNRMGWRALSTRAISFESNFHPGSQCCFSRLNPSRFSGWVCRFRIKVPSLAGLDLPGIIPMGQWATWCRTRFLPPYSSPLRERHGKASYSDQRARRQAHRTFPNKGIQKQWTNGGLPLTEFWPINNYLCAKMF